MESQLIQEYNLEKPKINEKYTLLKPTIRENFVVNTRNNELAIASGILLFFGGIISVFIFGLSYLQTILVFGSLTVFYASLALFLLNPFRLRIVRSYLLKTIEKPVEVVVEKPIEVYIDRPVEVVKEVPVIKEVVREVKVPVVQEVEKTVYVSEPRRKLNIPRYSYFGSSETKIFHKRSCRFSKLIKRKYKICRMNRAFFVRNHYKKCNNCLKK